MFRRFSSRAALWTLVLVCIASFSFMVYAAHTDSAIVDELAHIPAGYGYVHELSYNLNPEHPPLVKALAELPVLFMNPTFPAQSAAWTTQINAEFEMGYEFLYGSGNSADALIQTSRAFPILLTILTIILIYFLARELMGNWWALLPATLFALSPTVIAQGHYLTTDIGATFGFVLGLFYFLKFVESPTRKHLWFAGTAFGVAELTKFSTPLLIPLFIFLVFVVWLRNLILEWRTTARRFKTFFMRGLTWTWRLFLIFAIGYICIVYPVYFLFTAHYPIAKQVSDTQYLLGSFAGGAAAPGTSCAWLRCMADADIAMAHNPVLRPFAEYLLGIFMALQRVDGGNTIYFLGQIRQDGGSLYFPLLFLLKETVPTLIIVFVALVLALWWMIRRDRREGRGRSRRIMDYLGVNFAEFSMASLIVLYWAYGLHAILNIGIRHVLPTFPFIYILAAGVWKKWITRISMPFGTGGAGGVISLASVASATRSFMTSVFTAGIKYLILIALIIWLFIETIFAAPYFLSYYNEFAGGTSQGYHFVTDSNYDWGQDLLRLRSWTAANVPAGQKIAVDYFGGGEAGYYLSGQEVNWNACMGSPADQGIHWFAVSINTLQGAIQPLAPGQSRYAQCEYSWLTTLRSVATTTSFVGTLFGDPTMGDIPPPDARAGMSIFIYHLQ